MKRLMKKKIMRIVSDIIYDLSHTHLTNLIRDQKPT